MFVPPKIPSQFLLIIDAIDFAYFGQFIGINLKLRYFGGINKLLQPYILLNFLDTWPSLWVFIENPLQQALQVICQKLGESWIGCLDLLIQLIGDLILKWQIPTDHGIKNNSTGPDINFLRIIRYSL